MVSDVGLWMDQGLTCPHKTMDGSRPSMSSHKSRVLITTHNQEIALHANAKLHEPYHFKPKESWKLFLRKTFQVKSTRGVCPKELKNLGKNIAAKYKGLPLAIVVLGGLLSRKENTISS